MLIKNGTVFTKGTSFEKKEIEIEGIQIKSLHAQEKLHPAVISMTQRAAM